VTDDIAVYGCVYVYVDVDVDTAVDVLQYTA
jgi:hypothetical protein